jgi:2,3-bisphosphoglycerate-independent phosphoglycerate mutase
MPGFSEVYKLSAGAIATYPMYRGLAKLVGMNILKTGTTISDEVKTLKEHWNDYDFFFFHVKKTDSYGEDGDFDKKIKVIEEFDQYLPALLELKPDVVVVVGDHSTPVPIKSHSWHPVPFMISSKYVRKGANRAYDEYECSKGVLGVMNALDILPLMLANGLRLDKFGA